MLTTLNKINNFVNSRAMMVFDYLGAAGLLGYAFYKYSNQEEYVFWAVAGIFSLLFAVLRPAKIIQKRSEKKTK